MRKSAVTIAKTWNKDLEAGATLEGVYLKKEIYKGDYGNSNKYIIQTKAGEKFAVYSTSSLANQFQNVPEGSYVWIEYKGEEKSKKGRTVKVYTVEYDDEYSD